MSDSMWDHYRTGPCVTALHPLCAGGRCTCACHQPAQPPGEARAGSGGGTETPAAADGVPGPSHGERRQAIQAHLAEQHRKAEQLLTVDTVTVVLSLSDFRFATEYDPERERSASRRDMVTALEEIQALLRDNRVED